MLLNPSPVFLPVVSYDQRNVRPHSCGKIPGKVVGGVGEPVLLKQNLRDWGLGIFLFLFFFFSLQ